MTIGFLIGIAILIIGIFLITKSGKRQKTREELRRLDPTFEAAPDRSLNEEQSRPLTSGVLENPGNGEWQQDTHRSRNSAGLEPCPNCRSAISPAATTCPKCGQPLSAELWSISRETRAKEAKTTRTGCMTIIFGLAAAVALLLVFASSKEVTFRASEYGAAWPYPGFTEATIDCHSRHFGGVVRPVVTVDLGGITYGLNGAALGVGGYPDPRPLEGPDRAESLGVIHEMIQSGLTICR